MRHYGLLAIVMAGLVACSPGCRNGADMMEPGNLNGDQLTDISLDRLQPSLDPTVAVVQGHITLEGLTVTAGSGETTIPGGGTSAISQLKDKRCSIEILDPEDDILVIGNPDLGGSFKMNYYGAAISAKLQVRFQVVEDLNGDGAGGDQVLQAIPIILTPGRISQVTLRLRLASTLAAGVGDPISPDMTPTVGDALVAEWQALDANGTHEMLYAVFVADNLVVVDQDGDQTIEYGDDYSSTDADTNGWADDFESGYSNPDTTALYLEGVVTDVDAVNQQLTLQQPSGLEVTILVDPFTAIEPLAAGGEFLGSLALDSTLIGRSVTIEGVAVRGGYQALWIVVHDQTTVVPAVPGV